MRHNLQITYINCPIFRFGVEHLTLVNNWPILTSDRRWHLVITTDRLYKQVTATKDVIFTCVRYKRGAIKRDCAWKRISLKLFCNGQKIESVKRKLIVPFFNCSSIAFISPTSTAMTLKVSVRPVSNLSQFSFEVLSFRGLVSPLSPNIVRLTDPSVPAFETFEVTTTRSVQK